MFRFLFALLFATTARAVPTLSVDPPLSAAAVGEVFEIALLVDAEVGDLSCFAITLDFDPAVLEYVSAGEGALYTASLDPTFFQHSLDASGEHVFSDCVLGFGTSVSAPGELARISLRAIGGGSSAITIADAVLRDVDRAVIAGVAFQHGNVNATPTATPPAFSTSIQLLAGPNPSAGPVWFRAESLRAGTHYRLRVVDAQGRLVRELDASAAQFAATGVRWDGRDGRGRRVASGSYFAQLRAPDGVLASVKVLRVN